MPPSSNSEQAKEKTDQSALDELRHWDIGCEWIAKLWHGSSPLPSHNHAQCGDDEVGIANGG